MSDEIQANDDICFDISGNEAWLKYKAAEPLTAEELAELAQIDLDIWALVEQVPNIWTIGRKDKRVDIEWVDGKATGSMNDTGEITKTYMYQIKAKFIRKEPIALSPVIQPIVVNLRSRGRKEEPKKDKNLTNILFITDPHFGFLVRPFEKPIAFHSRRFLSDLLLLAHNLKPDYIVWGGDILDLAEFSRWPKKPEIIQKTQIAAIEAAWVIGRFGIYSPSQKIIEGNHDIRLPNATVQNFMAAYELKPTGDLEGHALLSIPRLLGFDTNPNVDWYSGWPDSRWDIGDIRFEHGSKALNYSGGTVAALLKDLTRTTIFGHIHRAERAEKNLDGIDGPIVAASPGGACKRETTPGAGLKTNWGIGAFYITMVDGKLRQLEHISHQNEETYFRGLRWTGTDYQYQMEKDIPEKFMQAL